MAEYLGRVLIDLITVQIICGPKEDISKPDNANGLVVLNQILADAGDDGEKIKTFSIGLARDATGTGVSLYNALEAAPSSTIGGLGGWRGAAANLGGTLYDVITVNAQPGGRIGPRPRLVDGYGPTQFGEERERNPLPLASTPVVK